MRNTHFIGTKENAQVALRETHLINKLLGMKTGEKIRQIRRQKGLTLSEVEHKAGLSDGNLSRIERGAQWPTEDKLQAIAHALDVTTADFFTTNHSVRQELAEYNAMTVDTKGKLPLISDVQAGNWSEIVDNFQPGDAEDWIPCPFPSGPGSFILKVVGLSMYNPGGEKSYSPGEYIAVDPSVEPLNKRMVVAKVDHEERATFKQLIVDSEGTMMLQALNPLHTPRIMSLPEGSRIVGVVIGKWTAE